MAMTFTEELLKQLKDQKFALDQSAIVAQTDARGQITMVNDRFCEISQYNRDELIGQTHKVVNSGNHPQGFFSEMWQTISSGKVWRGDICNRKKNGELYWVGTTITPFLDVDGRPYQYLAIRQDITALKQAQEIILAQQERLVTSSRLIAIGEMAAAITHEINNPLAVILGRAEMIQGLIAKNNVDPEMLTRLIDTIQVTGKRIEKIVRSMKSLAYQGQDDEPFYSTPMKEIVADALELSAQRLRNHGIHLKVGDVPAGLILECRSHQIVQVLVNLLNNSFDAIVEKETRWIQMEFKDLGDHVQITITDSGSGIPEDIRQRIFDPFFSTKRVQFGTGLGLSISRSLILGHNGDLVYDTTHSHTRFKILLPKRQP